MTDGLRKSHLRKAPQVGLSEVGLPEGNPAHWYHSVIQTTQKYPQSLHPPVLSHLLYCSK